jgi:hypothetical protein
VEEKFANARLININGRKRDARTDTRIRNKTTMTHSHPRGNFFLLGCRNDVIFKIF